MDKRVIWAVGIIAAAIIGMIIFNYGREAGVAAGTAAAIVVVDRYRRRGQESERVKHVVEKAHVDADEIREVIADAEDTNITNASEKTGEALAADIDELT